MKVGHGFILGLVLGFGACYAWNRYQMAKQR